MHTPDNLLSYEPYDTCDIPRIHKNTKNKRAKLKKIRRIRRIKCAFFISVFTFSFIAGVGCHMLITQSDVWQRSDPASYFFKIKSDDDVPSSTDDLQQELLPELTDLSDDGSAGIEHISSVSEEWNLVLVNPWNPIPDDLSISLTTIQYGQAVDSRCYPYLQEMLNDCAASGLQPIICSSYRTQEKQEALFAERMDELLAQGYRKKEARAKAATSVAIPGTSEHQLGLAVDIVDKNHQLLNATQENTPVQQWLMQNSWKYGFILRYPNDKSELTGIIYEPWHYRYVGRKAAKEIYRRGICLEEYLAGLQ